MKKIKSFQDISSIIKLRCDIRNDVGTMISYTTFLNMKLIDVLTIVENGEYTYDCDY